MTAIRPDVDPELSAVIDRALAKAPEDRFKDLAEMRRSLHRIGNDSRRARRAPRRPRSSSLRNCRRSSSRHGRPWRLTIRAPPFSTCRRRSARHRTRSSSASSSSRWKRRRNARPPSRSNAARGTKVRRAARSTRQELRSRLGMPRLAIRRLDEFQPAELVAEAREIRPRRWSGQTGRTDHGGGRCGRRAMRYFMNSRNSLPPIW